MLIAKSRDLVTYSFINWNAQVELESSTSFEPIEGDLCRDDEAILMEELGSAKDEIKNMKMRQAMVS